MIGLPSLVLLCKNNNIYAQSSAPAFVHATLSLVHCLNWCCDCQLLPLRLCWRCHFSPEEAQTVLMRGHPFPGNKWGVAMYSLTSNVWVPSVMCFTILYKVSYVNILGPQITEMLTRRMQGCFVSYNSTVKPSWT